MGQNITQVVADGADVNFHFREMNGWTVLHWAAAYGEGPRGSSDMRAAGAALACSR